MADLMARDRIIAFLEMRLSQDEADNVLLADGYESCFLGVTSGSFGVGPVAVYDAEAAIGLLQSRDGMSEEDAREYFEFNTLGAYGGPYTPLWVNRMTADDRQR